MTAFNRNIMKILSKNVYKQSGLIFKNSLIISEKLSENWRYNTI